MDARLFQKFGFLLAILVIFNSCNQQNLSIRVGILIPYGGSRFEKTEAPYMEQKIKELGGEAIVKSAESSEARQLEQAQELIEQGVDVIVIIAVNVNTAAAIVRKAHDSGVKVIAYDRLIRNSDLDFFISFDGIKVGELLAQYALEKVPEGNYVLMNGDKADENAVLFYNGTMKVLQPHIDSKKINIVYSGYMEGWSGDNAAYYANKIIEFGDTEIDVFLSQYDGLSDGIVRVLKERGLEKKMLVTGQDAEIAACNRIINDEQTMTIYKPLKKLAERCAKLVFELMNNSAIDGLKSTNNGRVEVPTILLDPLVVDKSNLESTVIADGLYSMDEVVNYNSN